MKGALTLKEVLRKKYSEIKRNLLFKDREKSSSYHSGLRSNLEKLLQHVLKSNNFSLQNNHLKVGTYISMPNQQIIPPSISEQFEQSFKFRTKYFTPHFTSKDRQMNFIEYKPNIHKNRQLCRGSFNVKVPLINKKQTDSNNDLNILLVPMICVQQQELQRIGYGGGYYDQFIRQAKCNNMISVGIALEGIVFTKNQIIKSSQFSQISNSQKIWNNWDQPLDFLVTQKRVLQKKIFSSEQNV